MADPADPRDRRVLQRIAALLATCALTLAGCTTAPADHGNGELLASHGLAVMEAAEIIDHLDSLTLTARPENLEVTVLPSELLLAEGDRRASLSMPVGSFYLAVAPYINHTHDCVDYSPIHCVGELVNAPVEVTITDSDTGEIVVSEHTLTADNGFLGYWLPRDMRGTVRVTHADFTGTALFTTGEDATTCLTGLRLWHRSVPRSSFP